MPAGRLARADGEEDDFTQTGAESMVVMSASAPDGTTGMQPGTARLVRAHVEYQTWEVWTNPSGAVDIREFHSVPMTGAVLSFNVTSGDGSVSDASNSTDNDGNGTAATATAARRCAA